MSIVILLSLCWTVGDLFVLVRCTAAREHGMNVSVHGE